jgi:plastocyanin
MWPKNTRLPRCNAPAWFCLLVAAAILLLSACGSATPGGAGTASTPTPTPTPTIAQPTRTPTIAQPTLTPAPGSTQVALITNNSDGSFGFTPVKLEIRVGTTVIWKNMSSVPHTVTSDDGTTFDSGTVAVGGTFHFIFKTAGTFTYHCNIHPYMRSEIIVV